MTTICFLHGFAAGGAVWHRYRSEFPTALMPTLQFTDEGTPLLPDLTEKTLLVGWSLGGMVAVEMAARQTEKVAGLVLISSAPSFVTSDLFPEGKSLSALHEMRDGIVRNDPRTLQSFQRQLFTAEEIKNGWLNRFRREIGPLIAQGMGNGPGRPRDAAEQVSGKRGDAHGRHGDLPGRGDHTMPSSKYRGSETARTEDTATISFLAQLAFLERWHAPQKLPDLPVTVIHGDGDTIVSATAVAAWQKLFLHATPVLVTGGHALPFTHYETIITTIRSLLDHAQSH